MDKLAIKDGLPWKGHLKILRRDSDGRCLVQFDAQSRTQFIYDRSVLTSDQIFEWTGVNVKEKADATEKGQEQKSHRSKHQDGGSARQAAEASGSDSAEHGPQGGGKDTAQEKGSAKVSLFRVHRLNQVGMLKAIELQDIFDEALRRIELVSGEGGRDMAIVRTKLQEASFFAKRAMAQKRENQELKG